MTARPVQQERPQLVLSLFPGIGLLDMAFEEEGFCVVRGPDLLWGGDIRRFHPPAGRFDGVIGGPPCQLYSQMRHINPLCGQKHGDLIPEYERVVSEARPTWFLMENVKAAPAPVVAGYDVTQVMLRDDWVGGDTMRLRRFSYGGPGRFTVSGEALHTASPLPAVTSAHEAVPVAMMQDGNGGHRLKPSIALHGGRGTRDFSNMVRDQGLPEGFLGDCPLTTTGKRQMIGNGVPLPMGRAVAKAVKRALGLFASLPQKAG